ncbi:hypothetical protein Droror1_Dr00008846 [Drosera rotundifolia]
MITVSDCRDLAGRSGVSSSAIVVSRPGPGASRDDMSRRIREKRTLQMKPRHSPARVCPSPSSAKPARAILLFNFSFLFLLLFLSGHPPPASASRLRRRLHRRRLSLTVARNPSIESDMQVSHSIADLISGFLGFRAIRLHSMTIRRRSSDHSVILNISRSIGDVYLKKAVYNREPLYAKFRVREPFKNPILSAEPSITVTELLPEDQFLIFASDGLWEHPSNQEAVDIVHSSPRNGSARKLVKAAL